MSFIKNIPAHGLSTLVVLMLMLSSCAPSSVGTPSTSTAPPKPAVAPATSPIPKTNSGSPRYGGTLNISTIADPPSLDAQQENSSNTHIVVAPAYNMLVEYQPQLGKGLFPGLAESWETSKDGLTYTFNIRKGVKFHDGSPLAPEDVVHSLSRLWKPPQGIRTALAGLLDPLKSVSMSGDQVRVDLSYAYSSLLAMLSYHPSMIYSKRVVEAKGDMRTTVVGTGPFKFKSYTPGVGIELVKNPDYWANGRPYLDKVAFLILKDPMMRLAALRTGRIKMTGRGFPTLTPSEMETTKKEKPDIVFYPSTAPIYPAFYMNIRVQPFSDKRVRKALSLSIDRQAALKVLSEGQGMLARVFPIDDWGIPDQERINLPGYRQPKDAAVAEAKRLMAEAGHANGFKLNILARTMAASKDSAVFLTSQFAKIGIDAKVEVLEDAVFWDRGRKAQHEAMVYTPSMSFPDIEAISRHFAKGGTLNFSGNDDDQKLNELWEKQRRALDENQRKAIVQEVERNILEEAQPLIPLMVPFTYLAHWPEVRDFSPGITEFGNNNLQDIWLAG